MKKTFFVLLCFIAVLLFVLSVFSKRDNKKQSLVSVSPSFVPSQLKPSTVQKESKSLFVPYWSLGGEKISNDDYDQLIYFGIGVDKNGINRQDSGYKKISQFVELTKEHSDKLLAVRMVDTEVNFAILKNKEMQKKIIEEVISLSKKYSFKGVVLDLEVSSFPFSSITAQINEFVADFYKSAGQQNLKFNLTLYADTFSRMRSYDVASLSQNTDRIMLMAYDFHKAKGDPGPNFPLNGNEVYGYDFKIMINDFLNLVSAQKLTVIFGLFGYDWIVDEGGKSIKQAESLSYNQVKERFLNSCSFRNCIIKRDEQSAETKVSYTAGSDDHIVWFEDLESVKKKKEFLKEKGIKSISFWAYSYF